jgi:TonB family protein
MKIIAVLTTLAMLGFAGLAAAECAVSSTFDSKVVPAEKVALRNAIFQHVCKQAGGMLVDGEDSALRGRLAFPDKLLEQSFEVDEDLLYLIRRSKAPAIVVFIVEPHGRVSWATLLESSGEPRLDSAALSLTRALDYKGPVTLDGKPVRVFQATARFGPINP